MKHIDIYIKLKIFSPFLLPLHITIAIYNCHFLLLVFVALKFFFLFFVIILYPCKPDESSYPFGRNVVHSMKRYSYNIIITLPILPKSEL